MHIKSTKNGEQNGKIYGGLDMNTMLLASVADDYSRYIFVQLNKVFTVL